MRCVDDDTGEGVGLSVEGFGATGSGNSSSEEGISTFGFDVLTDALTYPGSLSLLDSALHPHGSFEKY